MSKVKIIMERFQKMLGMNLHSNSHMNFGAGHCAMELVAYVTGSNHTDNPVCTSPLITDMTQAWNDSFEKNTKARTIAIKPILPLIIGTRTDGNDEGKRMAMTVDWAVRVQLPAWLRFAGYGAVATQVEALPEIRTPIAIDYAIQLIRDEMGEFHPSTSGILELSENKRKRIGYAINITGINAALSAVQGLTGWNPLLIDGVSNILNITTACAVKGLSAGKSWKDVAQLTSCLQDSMRGLIADLANLGRQEVEFVPACSLD